MNYIGTYKYKEIHANELKIPKYCIRFLFNHLIVRKIGISCEVVSLKFFQFFFYPIYVYLRPSFVLAVNSTHNSK